MLLKSILLLIATSSIVTSQPLSSERFDQDVYLDYDQDFRMLWNYNESHILIELRVSTTGWVGVGISENGGMINADIHVGWVKEGTVYISDRHGLGYNGLPPLDSEQNLNLIGGRECDGVTVLTFIRQLAACQLGEDRPITKNTLRVIYAFSTEDPTTDLSWGEYHGIYRGSKSLLLLQPQVASTLPNNNNTGFIDMISDGEPIPIQKTYYKCLVQELPRLDSKKHIIKLEPIIEATYRRNVHHIIVTICNYRPEVLASYVGRSFECYTEEQGLLLQYCTQLFAAWAVGGTGDNFPENVGLPIGEPGMSRYIQIEIHYDNPTLQEIRDSSGMRVIYTSDLREHDAGIFFLSYITSGTQLFIPPNLPEFNLQAGCSSGCLGGAMKLANVESINITNVYPHSHLAGRKMRLSHIRNGKELSYLVNDQSYDFDYQQGHDLSPEKVIRKGDELLMTCTYSSMEKTRPIVGGLDTSKEMCITFILYYPRIPLESCTEGPINGMGTLSKFLSISGTRQTGEEESAVDRDLDNVIVTSPADKAGQTIADVMSSFNWTRESVKTLEERMAKEYKYEFCSGPQPQLQAFSYRPQIRVREMFVEAPPRQCLAPSSGFNITNTAATCPAK